MFFASGPYMRLDEGSKENSGVENISQDSEEDLNTQETNSIENIFNPSPNLKGRNSKIRAMLVRSSNNVTFDTPIASGVKSVHLRTEKRLIDNNGPNFKAKPGRHTKARSDWILINVPLKFI
jgi:hypothetical protein